MKTFLLTIFSLSLIIASALEGEEMMLSLGNAIDSALVRNHRIQQQEEVVLQKEYLNSAAVGNFLPSVDLFAGYTYLSDNPAFNTEKIKESIDDMFGDYGAVMAKKLGLSPWTQQMIHDEIVEGLSELPSYDIEIDQKKYANANLVLTQPLFLGGEVVAGKRYALAELELAHEDLVKIKNEVINDVIQRYLSAILLGDVVRLREEVLSGMEEHEAQAKRAIEIGVISPPEIIRAQVAVANAERELQDAKNEHTLAVSALRTLLGLPAYTSLNLYTPLQFKDVALDLVDLKERALTKNSILKTIDQKQRMAEQAFAVERAGFLPKILAVGEYNIIRKNYPMVLPRYSVGVQLEMNLFHGFKKVNELKSAKHLIREVKIAKQYAESEIMLLVEDLYYKTQNSKTRYLKLIPTVNLAKKNLSIDEKRFLEGLGTSLEVIDARMLYSAAAIERMLSLYEYYSSLSKLYMTLGEPNEIVQLFQK